MTAASESSYSSLAGSDLDRVAASRLQMSRLAGSLSLERASKSDVRLQCCQYDWMCLIGRSSCSAEGEGGLLDSHAIVCYLPRTISGTQHETSSLSVPLLQGGCTITCIPCRDQASASAGQIIKADATQNMMQLDTDAHVWLPKKASYQREAEGPPNVLSLKTH